MTEEEIQFGVISSPGQEDANLQEEILEVYCDEINSSTKDDSDVYEEKCGNILISNSEGYILVCEFCNDRFKDMSAFGDHMETKHLNCDADRSNCFKITDLEIEVGEAALNDIVIKDDGDYPIEYAEVPVETLIQIDDKEFEKPDFDDENLKCNICEKQFTANIKFSHHKQFHKVKAGRHKKKKESEKVAKVSTESNTRVETSAAVETLSSTDETSKRAAPNPDLYCDFCDQYFKTPCTFKRHAVARHGNRIPKALQKDPSYFKCRFCHDQFQKPVERAEHEKTHDEDTPFKCSYCSRWFRVKYQRDIHENTHTGAHPYKCPHCPKAFKNYINRVQHIRMHLNIKRFECEYCGVKFVTNVEKSIHVRIHTKEKPYQCEDCGERFRVSGQLYRHRKRHYDQRDCECDICGAKFFSNHSVKVHRVLHFDDRPFECDICGRMFPRKRTLTTHRQLHDPVKKYQCSICDKKFAQSAGLHSHMKSHGERAAEL